MAALGRDASHQQAQSSRELEIQRIFSILKVLATAKKLREDREPVLVAQNLYVGSIGAAHNKDGLLRAGITHVLCVAGGLPQSYSDTFKYMTVEVSDCPTEDITSHFERSFAFISEAIDSGKGCLVHCFAGKSRSVTVVLAYLMRTQRCTLQAALAAVQAVRPIAGPNAGFMEQLKQFEESEVQRRVGRVYHTRSAAEAGCWGPPC